MSTKVKLPLQEGAPYDGPERSSVGEHTPGPWRAERGTISWKIMPPKPGHCIAYMDVEFSGWWPDSNPDPQRRVEANARLIASAPELKATAARRGELLREIWDHWWSESHDYCDCAWTKQEEGKVCIHCRIRAELGEE